MKAKAIEFKSREEWLRGRGIGGSDAAAILGLDPWRSPMAVYLEKKGYALPRPEWVQLERNRDAEPRIAAEYVELTGREVEDPGDWTIFEHPDLPGVTCTPDRIVTFGETGRWDWGKGHGPLSLKAVGPFTPAPLFALHYQIQLQHEIFVFESVAGSWAVMPWGRPLQAGDVERHGPFLDSYAVRVEEFLWRLKHDRPPPLDGSISTRKALLAYFGEEKPGTVAELGEEAAGWAGDLETLKDERRGLKERQEELDRKIALAEHRLIRAIGANQFGRLPDGSGFSLKTTHRAGFEVKPTSFRTLRRRKKIP